ncbi:10130_t:CDS:2 [Ambispora gerdemannii]|uniref:10130_t:CDS:1 n=1 Tax=Ambispora gerdemannii TaxID=144530 RepID=A0A9N8V4I6_9GLOM|nr:10130_t:CDS:2 [Ambispora gerdemannii]
MNNLGKRNKSMEHRIRFTTKKTATVLPPLELPFPPTIDPQQLVSKISTKKILARFPNAFIIYRNQYVQFLKSKGIHLSMTDLSPMISHSWKQENEHVKDAYTRLSLQAEKFVIDRDYSHFNQHEIDYALSTPQQTQFYSEAPILARPIAQRKIPPIYSSTNIENTNDLLNSALVCSASTSPTMEFDDFFKTTSSPESNNIHDLNSISSVNDNKFIPDCANIWQRNDTKIPGFAQLVQENCAYDPFDFLWEPRKSTSHHHHHQHHSTSTDSSSPSFDVDDSTLEFHHYHMNFFDSLNSTNSSPNENYHSDTSFLDFSPIVSS